MDEDTIIKDKTTWWFLAKFLGVFCLCYFGTLAVIGIAAPGGWYSPFVERYLDYVSWLKLSLIHATGAIFSLFDIPTIVEPGFRIRVAGGKGVFIAMDCVGYGVYSFWIAFVVANKSPFTKKLLWIVVGLFGLWAINVIRISLFLAAVNKNWPMPLGINHHTWFNIFAYLLIFILIALFQRSLKKPQVTSI
jgi:exosortase/archaeosortase family protein